jgi:hypothetical protein
METLTSNFFMLLSFGRCSEKDSEPQENNSADALISAVAIKL